MLIQRLSPNTSSYLAKAEKHAKQHHDDFGVVSICAVVFLEALYMSNTGLCTAEGSSAGELVAGFRATLDPCVLYGSWNGATRSLQARNACGTGCFRY